MVRLSLKIRMARKSLNRKRRLANELHQIINPEVQFVDMKTKDAILKGLIDMIAHTVSVDVLLNIESEINVRTTSKGMAIPCEPFKYRISNIRLMGLLEDTEIEVSIMTARPNPISKALKSRENEIIKRQKK